VRHPSRTIREVENRENAESHVGLLIGGRLAQEAFETVFAPGIKASLHFDDKAETSLGNVDVSPSSTDLLAFSFRVFAAREEFPQIVLKSVFARGFALFDPAEIGKAGAVAVHTDSHESNKQEYQSIEVRSNLTDIVGPAVELHLEPSENPFLDQANLMFDPVAVSYLSNKCGCLVCQPGRDFPEDGFRPGATLEAFPGGAAEAMRPMFSRRMVASLGPTSCPV
jgi:hypothetical protein